jgi:hypothetical protein
MGRELWLENPFRPRGRPDGWRKDTKMEAKNGLMVRVTNAVYVSSSCLVFQGFSQFPWSRHSRVGPSVDRMGGDRFMFPHEASMALI